MRITLPLIVLGYDEKRLYSVSDVTDRTMLPVFTDLELAEKYRLHIAEHRDTNLQALILSEPEKAVNLFEVILLIDTDLEYIIMNPSPPSIQNEKMEALRVWEFVQQAKTALLSGPPVHHKKYGRKAGSRGHPQNHQVKKERNPE